MMSAETALPGKLHTRVAAPFGKATKQDDQVMATNNSSIVSKRSVERLYYPDEPHFFRFFVKKFQRRAPLINRGYFLRLHVVDVLVRNFLMRPSEKPKIVVNLGCGSDVIPWQCLTRYPEHCQGVKFLDVDFPDLMERKRQTVLNTPELRQVLTGLETPDGSPVLLKSDQYAQIGCDLRHLGTLQDAISSIMDVSRCSFLFIAEVSITYMETEGAGGVIKWAASISDDAEFCLLEQILPDGPRHPFASTMLSHFEKLNTPLKSVHVYPRLQDQTQRFEAKGWKSVQAWTLWQAWADCTFLSASERRRLDDIEPFDEWEDFALFASHYCLIRALTREDSGVKALLVGGQSESNIPIEHIDVSFDELPSTKGQRRFGAAMAFKDCLGDDVVANVLGSGANTRLQSCDIFRNKCSVAELAFQAGAGPSSRLCHALVDIGSLGVLLSGGRTSPSSPRKDCWIFNKGTSSWLQTHDLPRPLYRHSATRLGESSLAFLVGGKDSSSGTVDDCLVYHPHHGWIACDIIGQGITAVSGSILTCFGSKERARFYGIIAGGLGEDGVISDQLLFWQLDVSNINKPGVTFTRLVVNAENHDSITSRRLLSRYGAACVQYANSAIICGGVVKGELLDYQDEILRCTVTSEGIAVLSRVVSQNSKETGSEPPRALFVGNSLQKLDNGRVISMGGGATCFSMGTFWNRGIYRLDLTRNQFRPSECPRSIAWGLWQSVEITATEPNNHGLAGTDSTAGESPEITSIPRMTLASPEDFAKVVKNGGPVVLEGLDLGSCVSTWNLDELASKIGKDRKVVVHEATTADMDFNMKNFRYSTMLFGEFIERVRIGGKLYLRALSNDAPADRPAKLADDFPDLAPDFNLPKELSLVAENLFSSVLRISGPVNMWLHYDVMANVYCQTGGTKRLVLFPPSDIIHFPFPFGASSSSVQVFSLLDSPELAPTHPHTAILAPGDVLFLPPLWLHATTPIEGHSIAVNVFFRDLNEGYSPGRDVYGNRDLAAYEKGRQDVAKIVNNFQKLPASAREFYLLRLVNELRQKIGQ